MKTCDKQHQWKFMHSSTIIFEDVKYEVDRYFCCVCDRVYTIDKSTGKRLHLKGLVGNEA